MEFSKTQRGNNVLIYLGFEYLQYRTTDDVIVWRCKESRSVKCHSVMKTRNGTIFEEPKLHSHESCPQKMEANKARAQMKNNMKAVGATPRNVIGTVLCELNNDVMAYLPRQSTLTRNLLKHKKDNHLPDPTSVNFDIPDQYVHLILNDTGKDDPDRILVVGSKDLLMELNTDEIYGDGTFDKVPNIYYQLYTWHAKVGNSYPPCVYFLLQKKNVETYSRMFNILKILLPNLSPQKILVDFEKASISAAGIAFPLATIKGCYFHLSQSVIRKIGNVGLKSRFDREIDTKLQLKSLAALAFVPPDDVRNVFDQLAATLPDEKNFNEVLTYFFSTYIEGAAGRSPQFPIQIWNQHDAALQKSPKTTNCCEGFHNALNSLFHCSHPSIWRLLDGLKKDLACHTLTLVNVHAGSFEVKKRKYENLYSAVASHVQNYDKIDDKVQYLRKLANLQ